MFAVGLLFAITGTSMACDGPDCYASGNFDISAFAAGGDIDFDGKLIPNGAAGGISGAGGVAVGEATGEVTSFKFWGRTITLGATEANIHLTAGGYTNTYSGRYNPIVDGDPGIGIGVYSGSENYAVTAGSLDVNASGLAYSAGSIGGIAGQGSLDGSVVGSSPLCQWNSRGVSYGIAGQGAVGGFIGGAGSVLYGDAAVEAGFETYGGSYSESYRAINGNTEIMGSNVSAYTTVDTYGNVDGSCLGAGFLAGGYIAAGGVATKTVQTTNSGMAVASANGSYSGAGELNCNFSGTANGYTQTSATQISGMNGSVMTSSAGIRVTIGTPQQLQ